MGSDSIDKIYGSDNPDEAVATHTSQETSWLIETPLTNHQWYQWRVWAQDPFGETGDWPSFSRFFVDENGVNDTPTIQFIEPVSAVIPYTSSFDLFWDDQDPDSNATISLYYDSDNTGADGILLTSDIMKVKGTELFRESKPNHCINFAEKGLKPECYLVKQ